MTLHDKPLCFSCVRPVEYDPVFASPCDHDTCPSSVFHPLCLMDWRQHREEHFRRRAQWLAEHTVAVQINIQRHGGGDPQPPPQLFPRPGT